jgi:hypothetical protein
MLGILLTSWGKEGEPRSPHPKALSWHLGCWIPKAELKVVMRLHGTFNIVLYNSGTKWVQETSEAWLRFWPQYFYGKLVANLPIINWERSIRIKTYSLRSNGIEYVLTISYFAQNLDGSILSKWGPSQKVYWTHPILVASSQEGLPIEKEAIMSNALVVSTPSWCL